MYHSTETTPFGTVTKLKYDEIRAVMPTRFPRLWQEHAAKLATEDQVGRACRQALARLNRRARDIYEQGQ